MGQKTDKSLPTLESAMQRITEVVAEMEEGNLPLETLITRNARGTTELKDFDPDDDDQR